MRNMRVLGLVGVLLALLVVGLLVKKQLAVGMPAMSGAPASTSPSTAPSLDAAMQAPRPMPDEAK